MAGRITGRLRYKPVYGKRGDQRRRSIASQIQQQLVMPDGTRVWQDIEESTDDQLAPMMAPAAGSQGPKGPKGDTGATGPSPLVQLGTVTIGQSNLIVLAGIRVLSVPLVGVKAGDRITLFPVGDLPAGYATLDAWCTTDGTLKVNVLGPALALLASYSFQMRVVVWR